MHNCHPAAFLSRQGAIACANKRADVMKSSALSLLALLPILLAACGPADRPANLEMVYTQRYQDKTHTIHADGEPVSGTGNARLIWRTHGIPMLWAHSEDGTFCFLDVGPGYRYAMIGTPDRKKLWIISR